MGTSRKGSPTTGGRSVEMREATNVADVLASDIKRCEREAGASLCVAAMGSTPTRAAAIAGAGFVNDAQGSRSGRNECKSSADAIAAMVATLAAVARAIAPHAAIIAATSDAVALEADIVAAAIGTAAAIIETVAAGADAVARVTETPAVMPETVAAMTDTRAATRLSGAAFKCRAALDEE